MDKSGSLSAALFSPSSDCSRRLSQSPQAFRYKEEEGTKGKGT